MGSKKAAQAAVRACFDDGRGRLLDLVQLQLGGVALGQQPLAQLVQAVVVFFPAQAVLALVALVRAAGAVALRLRQLRDVDEHGHVLRRGTRRRRAGRCRAGPA